jgi:cysteine desulfurase/selenocysteine lyase
MLKDFFRDLRNDFSILNQSINGRDLIYFDNAATSQKPNSVLRAMNDFYLKQNANVHRGICTLSEAADKAYEGARVAVQKFITANSSTEIIFTRNATESINLVAQSYVSKFLSEGDEILLSVSEHHSNLLPWIGLVQSKGLKLRYIDVDENGRLDLSNLDELLDSKVKFCAISQASNVSGRIHDLKFLISKLKSRGVCVLVDACQSVCHIRIDVWDLDCDFLAFSGHKMCGPMGIGVLYGRRELLQEMDPFLLGGGMVKSVGKDFFVSGYLPNKFEAGTPNVAGACGLAAAISYLLEIGFDKIAEFERTLIDKFLAEMRNLDRVRIFFGDDYSDRLAIFPLLIDLVHSHDLADFLAHEGICVRAGKHCAEPLMNKFDLNSVLRASLYFYNTEDEIERFFDALKRCFVFFK